MTIYHQQFISDDLFIFFKLRVSQWLICSIKFCILSIFFRNGHITHTLLQRRRTDDDYRYMRQFSDGLDAKTVYFFLPCDIKDILSRTSDRRYEKRVEPKKKRKPQESSPVENSVTSHARSVSRACRATTARHACTILCRPGVNANAGERRINDGVRFVCVREQ